MDLQGVKNFYETGESQKFQHHRPRRPRQVDARRPSARSDGHGRQAQHEGAAARHARPRARARHNDKIRPRAHELQGARRAHLRAEPHRHAGPRRLLIRGLALARGLRGRGARRRRLTGRRGADGGQQLPRGGPRPRARAGAQQDRPSLVAPRPGQKGARGHHRHQRGRRRDDFRKDWRGRAGAARAHSARHPRAGGRRGRAASGADFRFGLRQLQGRHLLRARRQRHARGGKDRPLHGDGPDVPARRGRRIQAGHGEGRQPRPRRGRLHLREHKDDRRGARRRHDNGRRLPRRRAARGIQKK